LIQTKGPAFGAAAFDPLKVTRSEVGTATFTFVHGNAATFSYSVNGISQSKSITRQLFAPPAGTRCGEPYRTPTSFTVVAAGDIANCASYYSFDAAAAAASAAGMTARLVRPGDAFVLTLGDAVYEAGTPAEYANCFHPTWGAFKDRIRPVPGNHDYYTSGAEGYFSYFGRQAGPDRRGYYSFDHGGWHFIMLNSSVDLSPSSEQYRWLISDLATSKDSLCTIAVLHYPAFNSGTTHGSVVAMRPAFEALYNSGVEIALSGHEHVYERFAPQKADGTADPARGVRQFTVGTGGAVLMGFGRPLPNSEFRYNDTWGILRLMLGEGNYAWQYVRAGDGATIDAGTGTCR
jgi:hypothetical protein